jgi:hypothetical protein
LGTASVFRRQREFEDETEEAPRTTCVTVCAKLSTLSQRGFGILLEKIAFQLSFKPENAWIVNLCGLILRMSSPCKNRARAVMLSDKALNVSVIGERV